MSEQLEEEELTEEQKAHIAVLRSKFFRGVSIFSVFGTIILLIILRLTVYNLKTVQDYEQYIDHKDKFMRFNAAKALGNFKNNPEATKALIRMLNDESREVRWHAAASLSKLKDPSAVPKLLQIIKTEPDSSAKSIYIYTLGQIGDEKAIPELSTILNSQDKKINPNDMRIYKLSTIQALASFKNPKANQILENFEKQDNETKELKDFAVKMEKSNGKVADN